MIVLAARSLLGRCGQLRLDSLSGADVNSWVHIQAASWRPSHSRCTSLSNESTARLRREAERGGTSNTTDMAGRRTRAYLRQLPLEVLVAVDAQLGVVREVRAELREERPEVLVHRVDVVVVHHRRRRHQPRIRSEHRMVTHFTLAANYGRISGLYRRRDPTHDLSEAKPR